MVRLVHRDGAARATRVAALRAALGDCDTWDAKYETFEKALRHYFHGEPWPPEDGARFFPKLRTLRDAIRAYEEQFASRDAFFERMLPAILRAADDPRAPSEFDAPGARATLPRSHAASWLSNAFLLNAPRGSALDWLGGGSDPIYVSGARIAPQKLMMLLAYFDGLAENADVGGDIQIERARCAPAAQPPVSLAGRSTCAIDLRAGSTEAHEAADATALVVNASATGLGGGALRGSTADDEEVALLCFCEAIACTPLLVAPLADDEAYVLRGLRRTAFAAGSAHQLRFDRRAAGTEPPCTLVAIDAARVPGCAQFAAPNIDRELRKLSAALEALRGGGVVVSGLWGSGGYGGAQPVLRLLLLALGAARAGVALRVVVPSAPATDRWFAGVLAELRARNQEPHALRQLLDEAPQTPKMLEVPAFASYAIRAMRGGAKRERPP